MEVLRKAIITQPFSVVQWHGPDYPYYEEDAEENMFQIGDEVLILHEAAPNEMGKLYVIYNERSNESTVVSENHFKFIGDE